jgi:DNA segregation ATPase FtsK/SpoIIIE-like protein
MSESIRKQIDKLGDSLADLESLEDFPELHAAEHVGTDLLGALLDEIKQLQSPWQSTPQHLQAELIDRLRRRVEANVKQAVALIAAEGRVTVVGTLEQVTFKGAIKATLALSKSNVHRLDMADNVGQEVLVVIMPAEQFTGGMDGIEADPDQSDLLEGVRDDQLYSEAVKFVRETRRASVSAVQRHLKIGYNRGARLIEEMELQGVVTAMNTNGSREVIG